MLNDSERAALVEELAEAMYEDEPVVLSGHGVDDSIVITWESDELDESHRYLARQRAASVMPIIDRLLTTRHEPAADAVDYDRLGSIMRMEYARGYQDAKKEGHVRTFSATSFNSAAVEMELVLDERIVRLEAQVRYLKDYAINTRGELMTAMNGGNVPTDKQLNYIIGSIEGNMEVVAETAVRVANASAEGGRE